MKHPAFSLTARLVAAHVLAAAYVLPGVAQTTEDPGCAGGTTGKPVFTTDEENEDIVLDTMQEGEFCSVTRFCAASARAVGLGTLWVRKFDDGSFWQLMIPLEKLEAHENDKDALGRAVKQPLAELRQSISQVRAKPELKHTFDGEQRAAKISVCALS